MDRDRRRQGSLFHPENLSFWRGAFRDLLNAIASQKVHVVGTRGGQREPVPGFHFADCLVDYPFEGDSSELYLSNETYLRSYPFIDAEHWRGGFDDSLVNRRGTLWSRLMVAKSDVRAVWPFDTTVSASSGFPGRPTSKGLVLAELERRFIGGEMSQSVVDEARQLSAWLAVKHRDMPQAKPKSIETSIRDRHREFIGRK